MGRQRFVDDDHPRVNASIRSLKSRPRASRLPNVDRRPGELAVELCWPMWRSVPSAPRRWRLDREAPAATGTLFESAAAVTPGAARMRTGSGS
jgi:hypothetical protein